MDTSLPSDSSVNVVLFSKVSLSYVEMANMFSGAA